MAQYVPHGTINENMINSDMINGHGVLPPTIYDTFLLRSDLIIPPEPDTVVFPVEVRELKIPGWPA